MTCFVNGTASPKVWIKLGLMQQTLGEQLQTLVQDQTELLQWYEPWAFLCQSDDITHVIGLLSGLTSLEFNLYLRPESETSESAGSAVKTNFVTSALSQWEQTLNLGGLAQGLQQKIELGMSMPFNIFEVAVQNQEVISPTVQRSHTVKYERINQNLNSMNAKLQSQLSAAQETIAQLTNSHSDLVRQLEAMEKTLETERRLRSDLESDLSTVNERHEAQVAQYKKDIETLQLVVAELSDKREADARILRSTQEELAYTLKEQAELNSQLERARMVARMAKAQLDKARETQE
ncbi:hypothetical protein HK102_009270 [Quaeritorhiza haematococci]|nr:hypothetical protein HK102_009270 [Quaeritorhiza haematococci]